MSVDRAALRRLCEGATEDHRADREADGSCRGCRAYGLFRQATSPAVVLALLDEIERLEREGVNGVTVEVADVTNDAATLAECGHLRAEVERLKRAFGVRGLGRHSTGPSVATREGDSDAS